MSVKMMSDVWEYSQAKGNQLLVLLAIADHCRDDGIGAYPSVDSLAKKCRLSPRAVQDNIRELVKLSELTTDFQAGPKGTNVYHVRLSAPESKDLTVPYDSGADSRRGSAGGADSASLKKWQAKPCPHQALHCNRVSAFCDRCAREWRGLVA